VTLTSRAAALLGLLVLTGCGEQPPTAAPALVQVTITGSDTLTSPGHTLAFGATGVDSDGGEVGLAGIVALEWSVSDTMRGRIRADGTFTGGPWVGTVWVHAAVVEPPLRDSTRVRIVPPGTVKWRWAAAEAGGTLPSVGGVALGRDGTVYVLVEVDKYANLANLVALDPTGRARWITDLEGVDAEYPLVTPGNEILVVGKHIHLVRPDGSVRWEVVTTDLTPSFDGGAATDAVAIASHGNYVTAYRLSDGDPLWQSPRSPDGGWLVPPTIVGEDYVYAKQTNDTLFQFGLSDGAVLRMFADPDSGADPSVFGAGTVPVGDRFYLPTWSRYAAFDTAGGLLWVTDQHALGSPEPAVGPDGTLFVQNRRWGLEAIAADGRTRWFRRRFLPPYGPYVEEPRWRWYGGPALAEGGILYGAGFDRFFAYDTSGNAIWESVADSAGVPQAFTGAPAIGPDGIVYTFTYTHVYALWASAPPEPNSPWPMWRHDAQRTGWVR